MAIVWSKLLGDSHQRHVVRLCAAGGEKDFIRGCVKQICYEPARLLDSFARLPASPMQAGGVTKRLPQIRLHRFHYTWIERRRRRMVEINQLWHILFSTI